MCETRGLAIQGAALFFLVSSLCGAEPLVVGDRRQLLMDDRFVESGKGIEFVVHPPRKTGDLIVASEPGLALGGYHTVLHDAGVYHLWYSAGACVLYARSSDGIHWEKPFLKLGKADPDTGVTPPSNAVLGRGIGGVNGGTHGLMVFLDPKAGRDQRFKLVTNPPEFSGLVQVFASADGIHWRHAVTNSLFYVKTNEKPHHLDSQNVIFWDDRLDKYVAYFRKNMREPGSQGRTVARAESPDLAHFASVEDSPVVMRADPEQVVHSPSRKERLALLDTYTNGALKYPWADDVYLMFPTEYYHYLSQVAEFREKAPINAGAIDTRFAASRDGINWRRYDHRPWVALGMRGEFDSMRIYMVYGVVPAANDRELYMYYLGTSETHGWQRNDENNRLLASAGLAPTGPSAISRVVLRRDGFVSVRSGFKGGEFTTPPLRFSGDQLLLNVDTSAPGELRVEILDELGQPMPKRTLGDCDLVHTANEISRVVRWNGDSSLKDLAGRPIRLHFVMRDTDLYAFQFSERGGI
jgi:hypothetical protein